MSALKAVAPSPDVTETMRVDLRASIAHRDACRAKLAELVARERVADEHLGTFEAVITEKRSVFAMASADGVGVEEARKVYRAVIAEQDEAVIALEGITKRREEAELPVEAAEQRIAEIVRDLSRVLAGRLELDAEKLAIALAATLARHRRIAQLAQRVCSEAAGTLVHPIHDAVGERTPFRNHIDELLKAASAPQLSLEELARG